MTSQLRNELEVLADKLIGTAVLITINHDIDVSGINDVSQRLLNIVNRDETNFDKWRDTLTLEHFIERWFLGCDDCPAKSFHDESDWRILQSSEQLESEINKLCENAFRKWANASHNPNAEV